MVKARSRHRILKRILIGLAIFIVLAVIVFQVFITRYLPPMMRQRLNDVIVKGSDSLYRLQMGKFDVSFWGASVRISDVHITIDSTRYEKMKAENRLPAMTFNINLKSGSIEGIGIVAILLKRRINIDVIDIREAEVFLARHFRTSEEINKQEEPLWKLLKPDINSIRIRLANCEDLKVNYQNVDSAKNFRWQFDKLNAKFYDILIDSASANDSSRLLFARNVALIARELKMKTPDGLYNLQADEVYYSSASRSMQARAFKFSPTMKPLQFNRHFGFQKETYALDIPNIRFAGFALPKWISNNRLNVDTVELTSPDITVSLDRNGKPFPYSKKGMYPHQLLQRAPFVTNIKRLKATNGKMTYFETNDKTQLTGKLVFPNIRGTITNITNDPAVLARSRECIVDINSGVMQSGKLQAIFRFNLADRGGAFSVTSTITNLNAAQLRPLALAMTATDLQSFNLKRLDYTIVGNEDVGKGTLKMKYDDMDILINKVDEDRSLKKRGFLSFLANRLVIYKENPMKDGDERTAQDVSVPRDAQKSFFNLIWKTLYSSAGEIVLRPAIQRRMEKKKQREIRRANSSR